MKLITAIILSATALTAQAQQDASYSQVAAKSSTADIRMTFCYDTEQCEKAIEAAIKTRQEYADVRSATCSTKELRAKREFHMTCMIGDLDFSESSQRQWDSSVQRAKEKLAEFKQQDIQTAIAEKKRKAEELRLSKLPGVRIGMTADQVIHKSNWARPASVNRTTTAHGTREQWVYGGQNYLYFTNGILTGIQN
jgi:hypothetical protein